MSARVAILATGDELVTGASVDTNSAAIARALIELGYEPARFVVLGDDEDGLVHALLELAKEHAALVVTGGLGPTLDDVTRHAFARAAGVALELDLGELAHLKELFASRKREFAASNERQALFPRGARVLPNPNGTACGFELAIGGTSAFALPGPPREMLPMLRDHVLPALARRRGTSTVFARASLYLFGLPESAFADACGPWMARGANPLVGVTAKGGVLSVMVRASGPDVASARTTCDAQAALLRERFAARLVSESEPDLAFVVGRECLARGITITLAESCTGGLAAMRLTRLAGVSAVFERSWVTYANEAKEVELGVPRELLAAHGAVSAQVAHAMAQGAATRSGARLAISITGIAGPDGGTPEKPVGTVWFGVSLDGVVTTEERRFVVRERDLVREFAANAAFDLARRRLAEGPR